MSRYKPIHEYRKVSSDWGVSIEALIDELTYLSDGLSDAVIDHDGWDVFVSGWREQTEQERAKTRVQWKKEAERRKQERQAIEDEQRALYERLKEKFGEKS